MAKAASKKENIEIQAIKMGMICTNLVGSSPMIMNRFAFKAWQELLLPSRRENRASLEQSLKHDPYAEFRGSVYLNRDKKRPTMFHLPTGAVHGAVASAALDMPGAAKAKIERLVKVTDLQIDLYGVPQIFCAMVRNSDINRTPDVRTRAIFPEWCLTITLQYAVGLVTERAVANLIGAAGVLVGIGDWRGQKGGPYGGFQMVGDNNAAFTRIRKTQARAAQEKAFESPAFFDADTEELLRWFDEEVRRREMQDQLGHDGNRAGRRRKVNGGNPQVPTHVETSRGDYEGVEA